MMIANELMRPPWCPDPDCLCIDSDGDGVMCVGQLPQKILHPHTGGYYNTNSFCESTKGGDGPDRYYINDEDAYLEIKLLRKVRANIKEQGLWVPPGKGTDYDVGGGIDE
ncbi:MAG: hypothetical protein NTY36_01340 [Deltaproteobacteria bacterium]|nr:hypothetical protein [Deltaproteobacteria bacterium]